jgi:hypothetical protein
VTLLEFPLSQDRVHSFTCALPDLQFPLLRSARLDIFALPLVSVLVSYVPQVHIVRPPESQIRPESVMLAFTVLLVPPEAIKYSVLKDRFALPAAPCPLLAWWAFRVRPLV